MGIIRLPNSVWQYDPSQPLGPRGGFGIVYAGTSQQGDDVAIKQISFEAQDAAHRELRIASELKGRNFEYVIPILDSGQDTDTGLNYLVMARAEKSLQQEINSGKRFSENDAAGVLLQIVKGLLEVSEVVHRDLKPGNILLHQGKWKVADFGIAKFIEDSTSLRTLQECLSPAYAAPEQWNYQRPTHAVDVYALGCIGYALVTGQPPFTGKSHEDLKRQHLQEEPPDLLVKDPVLRSLLSIMLRKTPETRPLLERVSNLLEQIITSTSQNSSPGFSHLSEAAAQIEKRLAKEEAKQLTEQEEKTNREDIAREAQKILMQVIETLFDRISNSAPNAKAYGIHHQTSKNAINHDMSISIGNASLSVTFDKFSLISKGAFAQSKWDVISGAIIKVQQNQVSPYEWSANLWYTNLGKSIEYRWWEVTYMNNGFSRQRAHYEPFAVNDLRQADRAASPAMEIIQLGARPKLADDEAVDDFCDRWAILLAKAIKGELRHPSNLPLD